MRVIFINHFNLDSDLDLDLDPIGACTSQLVRDITYDTCGVVMWVGEERCMFVFLESGRFALYACITGTFCWFKFELVLVKLV